MAQELDLASTMNSQSDFADLKSRFFNQLCPCGKSDRAHFSYIEEDGEILLRECTKCRDVIGLDDSTYDGASTMNSQTDFADLKSRFFNQLCRCGNGDRSHFSYVKVDGEILMRECKKCHDIIGLDDSTYDEVLSWLGDTENIRVSLCDCGNENPYAFVFEQLDDDVVLRCGKCRKVIWLSSQESTEDVGQPHGNKKIDPTSCECRKTKHVSSDGSTEAGGHPYSYTKIDRKSVWKLVPGDHVMWRRLLGYDHHAIVVSGFRRSDKCVEVIHYTSTGWKAKVVEEWVDLFKGYSELYRVEYKSNEVLSSDEVISRARKRLGEEKYGLFTNNCEHFARSCKTGVCECEQTKSLKSVFERTGAKTVTCTGAKAGARYTVRESLAALASKTIGKTVTCEQLCGVVSGAVAATFVVGIELYSFGRAVKKATDQLRDGEISQRECIRIVVERVFRTGGTTVGTIAGSFIPIPVVGTLVGCTLGSLIGEYIGTLGGRITTGLIAANETPKLDKCADN